MIEMTKRTKMLAAGGAALLLFLVLYLMLGKKDKPEVRVLPYDVRIYVPVIHQVEYDPQRLDKDGKDSKR